MKNTLKTAVLFIALAFTNTQSHAQTVVHEPAPMDTNWTKPYPPFRIVGNLYYVGTYDLACYLITTPQGHILINTGLASSAAQIRKSIEALGFKYSDLKILLTTQAHYDHMGAMATIKKQTGAKLYVDAAEADVLKDGGRSDYALGGPYASYAPVTPDRLLHDRELIKLTNTQLTLLHHPGHTKGSCSYVLTVRDAGRAYRVLIANMPTIVTDRSFDSIPAYPNIAKDYAYTLQAMKNVQFGIWVASHASQFGLHTKHKPGDAYQPKAFIGRADYDKALGELQQAFDKKKLQP